MTTKPLENRNPVPLIRAARSNRKLVRLEKPRLDFVVELLSEHIATTGREHDDLTSL